MVKMSQAVSLCVTDGFFIKRDKGKSRYLCVSGVLKLVEAVGIEPTPAAFPLAGLVFIGVHYKCIEVHISMLFA